MTWIDRLQRRFGFLAIPGLGRYIVGLQVLCFVVGLSNPQIVDSLILDPSMVARGELWRLVTFLCVPSLTPIDILFAIFFFMFQWMVFEGLEAEWGAFKLTLYCFLGWLCALALPMLAWVGRGEVLLASGFYWSISIELAFAYLYPDYTIYIFLILPVKMKWMAWLVGAFLVLQLFTQGLGEALPIAVGLLNYLIFFGPDFIARGRQASQVRQGRQAFTAARREAERTLGPRACYQCGAGPDHDLRLCTCATCGDDGKLWCGDHLAVHLAQTLPIRQSQAIHRPEPASGASAVPTKKARKVRAPRKTKPPQP